MSQSRLLSAVVSAVVFSLCSVQGVMAEHVKVEGVHICCGMCVKKINSILGSAAGVSNVTILQGERTVEFDAKDAASVQTGLKTLYDAGFYGKSSQPGPDLSLDASKKKNEIEITGLHMCCAGCTKAAEGALKKVPGVSGVVSQPRQGIAMISGSDISFAETLKALHEAGFHAKLK